MSVFRRNTPFWAKLGPKTQSWGPGGVRRISKSTLEGQRWCESSWIISLNCLVIHFGDVYVSFWAKYSIFGKIRSQNCHGWPPLDKLKIQKLPGRVLGGLFWRSKVINGIKRWNQMEKTREIKKKRIFCDFPYIFYRKSALNKQVDCRTPRTHFPGLNFCFQPSIGILDLWWKALRG